MLTVLVAGAVGLVFGVTGTALVLVRNTHRLVRRLSPAERLAFARKVTAP